MNYKSYALKTIAILMLCTLQTCHSGIIKNAIRTCQAHALTAASAAWLGLQGYKYMTTQQNNHAQPNNNRNWLAHWYATPWYTKLEQATTLTAAGYLVYKGRQLFSVKKKRTINQNTIKSIFIDFTECEEIPSLFKSLKEQAVQQKQMPNENKAVAEGTKQTWGLWFISCANTIISGVSTTIKAYTKMI